MGGRIQRRLRATESIRQPEIPVVDVVAAAMPLVCPGEDNRPGAAPLEHRPELALDGLCLLVQPVSPTVEPELCEQQRAVTHDVVKPRHVRLQLARTLEEDVEAGEVEKGQLQV